MSTAWRQVALAAGLKVGLAVRCGPHSATPDWVWRSGGAAGRDLSDQHSLSLHS